MSILLITALSLGGLFISYQVGKLITAPWRAIRLPKYVLFKYSQYSRMTKKIDLLYRGQSLHTEYVNYKDGDPVKIIRKVQKTLLRRFKATSMCGVFFPSKD